MSNQKLIIRASEIGEYVFCRRAWWLHHIIGLESANQAQMQAGAAKHMAHGIAVRRADAFGRASFILLALAILFALALCVSVAYPVPR